MTERERLQASLRQTLTEFKEQQSKEKRNGQAAQGGQKAENNRLVGNYLVGKLKFLNLTLCFLQAKLLVRAPLVKYERVFTNLHKKKLPSKFLKKTKSKTKLT